jgi:hypothetical protein
MANILALAVKSQAKHMGGVILSRPARCTRGSGDRFGVPNPRESGSVIQWGGPETVLALVCVAERRATRPNESRGVVLAAICWAPSAQRWCHPEEALYLPTFSRLLIVNILSLPPFSPLSLTCEVPFPPRRPGECRKA